MKVKDKNELATLQKAVLEANLLLYNSKLALHTWGNVSAISKDRSYYVIKPSGIPYEKMQFSDMVAVDLENNVLESELNPSSDTPTHSLIYKADHRISAIVHTHSPFAVSWAQAGKEIPALGTTHADNFFGAIPCTDSLTDEQINGEYEHNTGLVILDHFRKNQLDFIATPGVLVKEHGPFCWSDKSAIDAVKLAMTFEEIAKMAFYTKLMNPLQNQANPVLQRKHYNRKHGKNAYYGQKK
ncbi:L-ribulose-5-phosphate 4-epimerase [Mesomycoplasma flocculare]|uniref:L-ribulose-5-phosphate 4-epimerase n=1 Tax=Mesomycoplasma flocculare ATCC 27399 TaxID=743971 RepID=A0A0A8ECC4_MESFC|nr:L-ribulose-5-phosphate 4-epimerase [Mesomycoplasma flocculare]AJC49861.1 L-ribulose-5-phosphate 4-epimerase [Mesomycoplasma flocculare ATCC 27399]ENX51198.1 sugar isomerase SgaE [Mesomycoplasma flocculare ATCC 27716]